MEQLGRMVVLDLVLRNNDRFALVGLRESGDDPGLLSPRKAGAEEKKVEPDSRSQSKWHPWDGNEENFLIDLEDSLVIPIDSQFTSPDYLDEEAYVSQVVKLITDQREQLAIEAVKIIGDAFQPEFWQEEERTEYEPRYKKALEFVQSGIMAGVEVIKTRKKK
jgi:hypothetical protein